jgi:hypothetical protein
MRATGEPTKTPGPYPAEAPRGHSLRGVESVRTDRKMYFRPPIDVELRLCRAGGKKLIAMTMVAASR